IRPTTTRARASRFTASPTSAAPSPRTTSSRCPKVTIRRAVERKKRRNRGSALYNRGLPQRRLHGQGRQAQLQGQGLQGQLRQDAPAPQEESRRRGGYPAQEVGSEARVRVLQELDLG